MRSLLWWIPVVLGLALLPWFSTPFILSLTLTCLMYTGLAVSWAMFCGPTGYLSLAGAAYFGLGAYCSAWGVAVLPWPVVVVLGGLSAVLLALLIGLVVLHLRGAYFAVITFGLGALVAHSVTYIEKSQFGTVGRVILQAPEPRVVYWTVLSLAVLAVLTHRLVERSRLGLALRGIGADEQRAATLGVDPRRMKLIAFALSSWFAGAIGAAMAVRWTYIDPHTVFNPVVVFQTVVMAMVGGARSLRGPIIGAVLFSLLAEFLRLNLPYLYMVILGALLIVSVLYLPEGLAGLSWRRFLTRPRARAAQEAPHG